MSESWIKNSYKTLYKELEAENSTEWARQLPGILERAFLPGVHRELLNWQQLIAAYAAKPAEFSNLSIDQVEIGHAQEISQSTQHQLKETLQLFHPWRKGPFSLFGVDIDTEWHSDWKWQRLEAHITPLQNRLVLDVGCGNGYHCWRMRGAGAKLVIGVDPLLLNVMQFQLIKALYGPAPIYVLPMGIEMIPKSLKFFDTVFSMGVLYHRRSPIDHLFELRDCLKPGGELVLETLIIEGAEGESLMPEGRYAKMRNVWFIPSIKTLLIWLKRCGFTDCRVVDINQTSIAEQRTTEWMRFNSLQQFLDPDNVNLTCEGLPAPKRAMLVAKA